MLPILELILHEACRANNASRIRDMEFIKCHEALTEAGLQGNHHGQVVNLLKLAEIYPKTSPEEKRGYYQKALTVAQNSGETRLVILANVFLARFFFNQADYRGADLYLQNAGAIAEETNDIDAQRYISEERIKNGIQLKLEEMIKQSR